MYHTSAVHNSSYISGHSCGDIDLQWRMSPREQKGEHANCFHCTVEHKPVSWLSVHTGAPRAVLSRWLTAEL